MSPRRVDGARRLVRKAVVAAGAYAAIVGCGALLGYEEIDYAMLDAADGRATDDGAPAIDASPDDAGAEDNRSDAGDAAVVCANLILNAGFESKPSCDPWENHGGPIGLSSSANSGANACRACAEIGAVNATAKILGPKFAPGDRLHFEISARAENSLLLAREIRLVAHGGPDITVGYFQLGDTYQSMEVDHLLTADGGDEQAVSVQIFVLNVDAGFDAGACMLFDDVTVCVTRDAG